MSTVNGQEHLKAAIGSIPSGMIIAAALQPSLFPIRGETTADLYLLGEGERPIELHPKFYSSMYLYFMANGVTLSWDAQDVMTLTSEYGPVKIMRAVEGFLTALWS